MAADILRSSPTYGQWIGEELSPEKGRQLLIPARFLHGFVTREPNTEIVYKCTDYYAPECDAAIRFDDPDVGIDWGLPEGMTVRLSNKDARAGLLRDFISPFSSADCVNAGSKFPRSAGSKFPTSRVWGSAHVE